VTTVWTMFGYCTGQVIDSQVILTPGGLGLTVATAAPLEVGSTVNLWVTTVVRQDAIICYGFPTQIEQALFSALTRPAGSGAGAVLSLLGTLGVSGVVHALRSGNDEALRRANGVGPTLARRLIAEVRLPELVDAAITTDPDPTGSPSSEDREMVDTLVGLGFNERDATAAVAAAHAGGAGQDGGADGERELLSVALRHLRGAA
jgi:holliday junction DNA helicase RuvA